MSLVAVKEEQSNAVFVTVLKSPLTSCALLKRWRASVLKVDMPCLLRSLQDKLVCSVTVRIQASYSFILLLKGFITKVPEY